MSGSGLESANYSNYSIIAVAASGALTRALSWSTVTVFITHCCVRYVLPPPVHVSVLVLALVASTAALSEILDLAHYCTNGRTSCRRYVKCMMTRA